jgi:hypothetical protein
MHLPCAGIAQQHDICLADKVRERMRASVLWPVRRDVCSANDSSHLDRLVIRESSKLPVIANLCQARQAVRTKVSAASAGRSISDDQRFKLGKGGFRILHLRQLKRAVVGDGEVLGELDMRNSFGLKESQADTV